MRTAQNAHSCAAHSPACTQSEAPHSPDCTQPRLRTVRGCTECQTAHSPACTQSQAAHSTECPHMFCATFQQQGCPGAPARWLTSCASRTSRRHQLAPCCRLHALAQRVARTLPVACELRAPARAAP
eukprot:366289-Chlamydomonas_euryale.AAC.7